MKSVIYGILFGLSLVGSVATASSNELSYDQTVKMGDIANLYGYNCRGPIIAFYRGENQYGKEFVLTCQSGKFSMILRLNNGWIVRPK